MARSFVADLGLLARIGMTDDDRRSVLLGARTPQVSRPAAALPSTIGQAETVRAAEDNLSVGAVFALWVSGSSGGKSWKTAAEPLSRFPLRPSAHGMRSCQWPTYMYVTKSVLRHQRTCPCFRKGDGG